MHQDHNIPWQLLSRHLKLEYRKDVTPPKTDFFPRNLPTQASDLEHFRFKFIATIKDFSKTERAKYPAKIGWKDGDLLYSDELIERHPKYLTSAYQHIQRWRQEASYSSESNMYGYNTGNAHLADIVKILLIENETRSLLALAQDPKTPISRLHFLSWGHSFGFSRVTEGSMDFYMFFNLLDSLGVLHSENWKESASFQSLLSNHLENFDFPAQQTPHQDFWGKDFSYHDIEVIKQLDPLKDMNRLKEYLKLCFAILYRYDMLCTELGIDPEWESVIAFAQVFRSGGYRKIHTFFPADAL